MPGENRYRMRDYAADMTRGGFYATESIGPRRSLTPEGFMICHDVPLARAGEMLYTQHDLPALVPGADGYIRVERGPQDIFRPETLASIEGKAVTIDHPDEDVNPDNWGELSVGHVTNPREGQGDLAGLLIGDLVLTKKEGIEAVRDHGLREVSLGYDAEYLQTEPGRARQHNIIVNHNALVRAGRCGPRCAVGDKESTMTKPSIADRLRAAFLTRDNKALDEALESLGGDAPATTGVTINLGGAATKDAAPDAKDKEIAELKAALAKTKDKKAKDAEGEEDDDDKKKKTEDELVDEDEDGKKKKTEDDMVEEDDDEDGTTMDSGPDAVTTYTEVVARAEIIAPGYKLPRLTKDAAADPRKTRDGLCICKRRALDAAMKNETGKAAVSLFLAGRTIDKLSCSAVDAAFLGASEQVKAGNNIKAQVRDGKDPSGARTVDAWSKNGIDKINANFWKTQGKE